MANAKHTPGPWEIQNPMGDSLWIVQANRQAFEWSCIASVSDDTSEDAYDRGASRPITTRERDANARLIAAAPDLLEVLQAMMSPRMDGPDSAEIWQQARAAISKATDA